jgi:tRNA-dihydrouridine synthase B
LRALVLEHIAGVHTYYGEPRGVRVARKHIGWYLDGRPGAAQWRPAINQAETAAEQLALLAACFYAIARDGEIGARQAA